MNTKSFSKTINGRVFNATKSEIGEPWEILYPEGQFRFYGTQFEASKQIDEVASKLDDDSDN